MDTKGERGEGEELGDWGWHIYTTDIMYNINNWLEHIIQQRNSIQVYLM